MYVCSLAIYMPPQIKDQGSEAAPTHCSQEDIAQLRRDCVIISSVEMFESVEAQVMEDKDESYSVKNDPCEWARQRLEDHEDTHGRVLDVLGNLDLCS